MNEEKAAQFLEEVFRRARDEVEAREAIYIALQNQKLLNRVTLHKYMCAKKNCQIARVFRVQNVTLCWVRDYKYSPGLNEQKTIAAAREKNTLDGDRHWPWHVHDLDDLVRFESYITMTCRHVRLSLFAKDVLDSVAGIEPGHPSKPTRLM